MKRLVICGAMLFSAAGSAMASASWNFSFGEREATKEDVGELGEKLSQFFNYMQQCPADVSKQIDFGTTFKSLNFVSSTPLADVNPKNIYTLEVAGSNPVPSQMVFTGTLTVEVEFLPESGPFRADDPPETKVSCKFERVEKERSLE